MNKPLNLEALYQEISTAKSLAELGLAAKSVAATAESPLFVCEFVPAASLPGRRVAVHNLADTMINRMQRLPVALLKNDPLLKHMHTSPRPLIWGQQNYVDVGAEAIWEESAASGLASGIAIGLTENTGVSVYLGVARSDSYACSSLGHNEVLQSYLVVAAVCMKARAQDLWTLQTAQELPKFTPREMEALQWTREGKTAWELGTILGVSSATANFHLQNIQRKLNTNSKHHAVLRAIELGLID
jgi:DNA-binding CsgD family transcriptional regulator